MGLASGGVLVVDKPGDWSSAQVVDRVKRRLGVRKAGHTGTLDPFATGVLVVLLNSATRLARFLLADGKVYEARMRLGEETDTQDRTGRVLRREPVRPMEAQTLKTVLERFEGSQEQLPPVYSALKHQGVPLYRLARQGRPVQKAARRVHIDRLRLRSLDWPDVDLEVACSAGTYVRTLCADIGRALGCGGHLRELRRTRCGPFHLDQAVSLEELDALVAQGRIDACLLPPAAAVVHFSTLEANDAVTARVHQGQAVTMDDFDTRGNSGAQTRPGETLYRVLDRRGALIAVLQRPAAGSRLEYACVFPAGTG